MVKWSFSHFLTNWTIYYLYFILKYVYNYLFIWIINSVKNKDVLPNSFKKWVNKPFCDILLIQFIETDFSGQLFDILITKKMYEKPF